MKQMQTGDSMMKKR